MIFGSIGEIKHALMNKSLSLHASITARYDDIDDNGNSYTRLVKTTPGRMFISEVLPKHKKVPFSLINKVLNKREVTNLIDHVYRFCGQKETVIFADRLMQLGFTQACKAGISFGKDDMIIPGAKEVLVSETRDLVKQYEKQYSDGLITLLEKYNKVVDAWSLCTDKVANEMMDQMSIGKSNNMNSVFMMADSGARGSQAQMKQLAGMRGLMAKPSGDIIETPVISNFKEGLSVLEYFNSTHGARKGLADTALKTANSGYLTRRLVDVAQDVIVIEADCGTSKGLKKRAVTEGGEIIEPLEEQILGRNAAEDIIHPESGNVLVKKGDSIDEINTRSLVEAEIDEVTVRSALTCETKKGICAKCYGRDLARGTPVNLGEAVGVIAAQSIGEPGTQLTMRTFHIGGAAQAGGETSSVEAFIDGMVNIEGGNTVKESSGNRVVMSRNCEVVIVDENNRERSRNSIPYGSRILIDNKSKVKRGDKIAEWDPYTRPILSEKSGNVKFIDLIDRVSLNVELDENTGISKEVVQDWRGESNSSNLRPRISIMGKNGKILKLSSGVEAYYELPVGAVLSVTDGGTIEAGDPIARIPLEQKLRDITGGLPRVAELFEARRPKEHSIISETDGRIEFGKDYKAKRRLRVVPVNDEENAVEYLVPKGKHIAVQEGDLVSKGELLMDGNPVPHDILRVLGVEALANHLVNEIQNVYRMQGVKINDKHIEVISRQMMQKVEITDPGDTIFLTGEQVDRTEFEKINNKAKKQNQKEAASIPVLQGITKASLQTNSFISAASFQETTRVLTDAAVTGKVDSLLGLKENVIVGRLIPAGTGRAVGHYKRVAAENDRVLLAEKEAKKSLESEQAEQTEAI